MIIHIVDTDIFWLNAFPQYKPGAILSHTKYPVKLFLETVVYYKKVSYLRPVKYVQLHQQDEPRNTIDIQRTVVAIVLGPQYNLRGGYFSESLLTGKLFRRSHWTPVDITEYVIEFYDTFNTKGFTYELLLGNFHCQPIPPDYYDFLNDNGYNDNNTPITPVGGVSPDKNQWKMQSLKIHLALMVMVKILIMIE